MKHVLVAIDFSPQADLVLATAATLAGAIGADVTVLHVAAPDPDFVGFEVGPQSVRDSRAEVLEKEHRELHRIAERLREDDIPARAFLFSGATAEKILEEASARSADLIVMGTHGRSGLASAFVGSVSRAVLHGATCPVVVVPASIEAAADR
jgi:nucleotide-binding universal stress UspA family protein